MRFRQQLVSSLAKTDGTGNLRTLVTIHETANTAVGANAAAHANLQSKGNVRQASWHWTVDDTEAVQSFQHNVRCWHAGTNRGNSISIGVEICVNSDGNFAQTLRNAAKLVAHILRTEGLDVSDIVNHRYWTGKNCPTNILAGRGATWSQFLDMVRAELSTTPENGENTMESPETRENVFEIRKYLGILERNIVNAINSAADKIVAAIRETR